MGHEMIVVESWRPGKNEKPVGRDVYVVESWSPNVETKPNNLSAADESQRDEDKED